MRKFIFKIVGFLLLFLSCIWLVLALIALSTNWTLQYEYKYFGHRTHWGSSLERVNEFEQWATHKTQQPKGLLIGSSTAYRNLNPHILSDQTHINWFNYGSSNQSPKMSYFLLQQAFARTKLDYVLLDIYGPIAKHDGLEAAFDLIYNSELNWWQKTQLLWRYPNTKLWLRYGYFYTKKILPCPTYIIQDSTNGTYLKKGFVCSNQPALQHPNKAQKSQKIPDFTELQQIAKLCQANKARLILNIAPSLKASFVLPTTFRKYPVIHIKHFNNPRHFYDDHHMTCEGATAYTQRIEKKLFRYAPPPQTR
jgi:hypothetical protein